MLRAIPTDKEVDSLIGRAKTCIAQGGSVEEMNGYIDELRVLQQQIKPQRQQLVETVKSLEKINDRDNRDEVKETVRALLRVFSSKDYDNDLPQLGMPLGIDCGKGPFDAYDVLDPKPWKPTGKKSDNKASP